jgi:hypothetical protein
VQPVIPQEIIVYLVYQQIHTFTTILVTNLVLQGRHQSYQGPVHCVQAPALNVIHLYQTAQAAPLLYFYLTTPVFLHAHQNTTKKTHHANRVATTVILVQTHLYAQTAIQGIIYTQVFATHHALQQQLSCLLIVKTVFPLVMIA